MSLRVDKLVYFDADADADLYITALAGVTGVTGVKITRASNATLVVTTSVSESVTAGRLHKANRGTQTARLIRKIA